MSFMLGKRKNNHHKGFKPTSQKLSRFVVVVVVVVPMDRT